MKPTGAPARVPAVLHAACTAALGRLGLGAEDDRRVREAVAFCARQRARLPVFFRLGLAFFSALLQARALVGRGRLFSSLPPESRAEILDRWRGSRHATVRDFVRFHEGLAVYGWHASWEEEPERLGGAGPA